MLRRPTCFFNTPFFAISLFALLNAFASAARLPTPYQLHSPFQLRHATRAQLNTHTPRVPPEFNLNSGGPVVGRFIAEHPSWIIQSTQTTVFVTRNAEIGGAELKNLPMYLSHRFGVNGAAWGYDIPVSKPGIYGCTAHFAETALNAFQIGARIFNLTMATAYGDPVIFPSIDIFQQLNKAQFTVLTKTAPKLVVTGVLSIRITPIKGDPMISGLTCERLSDLPENVKSDYQTPPNLPSNAILTTSNQLAVDVSKIPKRDSPPGTPVVETDFININIGGRAKGRFISDEAAWIRGTTSSFPGPPGVIIGGAESKNELAIRSHRYGRDGSTWSYVIPVSNPGIYDCSLHFAETDTKMFSVGARVFDVSVQGNTLKNIDVFKETNEAEFTALVKTFTDILVPSTLVIDMIPKVGNAFLSAITCDRMGELPKSVVFEVYPSPDTLSPSNPVLEDPEDMENQGSSSPDVDSTPFMSEESPEVTPSKAPGIMEPAGTLQNEVETSTVPDIQPSEPVKTSESPSLSPAASTSAAESIEDIQEQSLSAQPDEILRSFSLRVDVTGGDLFTMELRNVIKKVSQEGVEGDKKWAMTTIIKEPNTTSGTARIVVRQEASINNSYGVTLDVVYDKKNDIEKRSEPEYAEFINSGSINSALSTEGFNNVAVSLRAGGEEGQVTKTGGAATGSRAPIIAGAAVGGLLAALIGVALVVFFIVRRNNRKKEEPNYDLPPPTVTESEMSSVVERSETAASVEYLDDDSTFTAATSRAGDNAENMAYVKDAFGRGTDRAQVGPPL